jgi:hypothetical protein
VLARDNLAHALLDLAQVVRLERAGLAALVLAQVEVVLEAVLDRRANGDLGLRVKLKHRLRHAVGRAVPQLVKLFLAGLVAAGANHLRPAHYLIDPLFSP